MNAEKNRIKRELKKQQDENIKMYEKERKKHIDKIKRQNERLTALRSSSQWMDSTREIDKERMRWI